MQIFHLSSPLGMDTFIASNFLFQGAFLPGAKLSEHKNLEQFL